MLFQFIGDKTRVFLNKLKLGEIKFIWSEETSVKIFGCLSWEDVILRYCDIAISQYHE
jgi:hypothetical protein